MKHLGLFLTSGAILIALYLPGPVLAFTCAAYVTNNDNVGVNDTQDAQGFVPTVPCAADSVIVNVNTTGGLSNVSLDLEGDNTGHPDGTVLDTCTESGALTTGANTFTCTGVTNLSTSNTYYAVWTEPGSALRFNQEAAGIPLSQYLSGTWQAGSGKFVIDVEGHTPSGGGGGGGGGTSASSTWTGIASSTCMLVGSATVCMTDAPSIPTAGDSMRNLFYGFVLYLWSFFGTVWLLRRR